MITRIIYTELWQDDFFISLNSKEKLIFIYYLTNESVNIIHLYRCSLARISGDTGIDTPIIIEAQKKFEKAEKIYFNSGFVFLKNAHKFEKYNGEKNEVSKLKLFSRLSKSILDWYNSLSDTPMDTPMDTPTMIGSINHKSETLKHKSIEVWKDVP